MLQIYINLAIKEKGNRVLVQKINLPFDEDVLRG